MSTVHCSRSARSEGALGRGAFETRDFYLACFLRCTGYELLDLRDEGRQEGVRVSGPPNARRRSDGVSMAKPAASEHSRTPRRSKT